MSGTGSLTRRGVEIVFETHSTSEDNERGIASGWLDAGLSDRGRSLAHELGERRRRNGINLAFSSDLKRPTETADIALSGTNIPVRHDARLRECNYGTLTGRPTDDLAPRSRFIEAPFPGGESYRDVAARVRVFLLDLRGHDVQRVLVIGHSATRWALDHLLDGASLDALVDAPFSWRPGWTYWLRDFA